MIPSMSKGLGLLCPWTNWGNTPGERGETEDFPDEGVQTGESEEPPRETMEDIPLEERVRIQENPWFCTDGEKLRIDEIFNRRWFFGPPVKECEIVKWLGGFPPGTFSILATEHPKIFWLLRNITVRTLKHKSLMATCSSLLQVGKDGSILFENQPYSSLGALIKRRHLLIPLEEDDAKCEKKRV